MATLADVSELIVDCEHKTAPTAESGYPSIRTTNIGRGRLELDGVYRVSEGTYREWTRRAVPQKDDIILAREAPVGNAAIIPEGLKVCLGQRTVLIRPDQKLVAPNYLTYLLLTAHVQGRFHGLTAGATVPHLNVGDIRQFELPALPPLRVQQEVGDRLADIDDLIENNARRVEILQDIAQAIYREWFVSLRFPGHQDAEMVESDLGMIPDEWEVGPYSDLAEALSGGTPKTKMPEYWDGEIPFFTPKDASGSFFVLDTAKHVTPEGVENCSSELYPPGTVFITARGTVGKTALNAVPMAMNQSCYALRGKGDVTNVFAFFAIRECVDRLQRRAHGAVFDTIIMRTFDELQVVKPPLHLIRQFTQRTDAMMGLMLALLRENEVLRETRDLLLLKLVSGEISVDDIPVPDDAVA